MYIVCEGYSRLHQIYLWSRTVQWEWDFNINFEQRLFLKKSLCNIWAGFPFFVNSLLCLIVLWHPQTLRAREREGESELVIHPLLNEQQRQQQWSRGELEPFGGKMNLLKEDKAKPMAEWLSSLSFHDCLCCSVRTEAGPGESLSQQVSFKPVSSFGGGGSST